MSEERPRNPFEVQRDDPERFEVGDLVNLREDIAAGNRVAYRVLAAVPTKDPNAPVFWVGPHTLTTQDIRQFQEDFRLDFPLSKKFENCIPVNMQSLVKILDS